MQSRILYIALGATLLGTPNGLAQESSDSKVYADLGYARLGSDLLDLNSDEQSIEYGGLSGHVGYQFSDHWSVEGEAILGVENDKQFFRSVVTNVDGVESYNRSVKTDLSHLIGVYAKGSLPITDKLDVFARLGIANADFDHSSQIVVTDLETEESTSVTSDGTMNETGIALGVGLSFQVTDKLYLRTDYTQYDLVDVELDSVSVGIGVRF
ncbi:MAG: porin family protein [Pseudomonadota bacterium]